MNRVCLNRELFAWFDGFGDLEFDERDGFIYYDKNNINCSIELTSDRHFLHVRSVVRRNMSQDLSSELYQALVLNAIQPLPPTSFLGIEPPNDHLVLHHLISTHLVGRESIEKLLNDFSERAQNLKSQMEKDDRDKCDHSLMKKSNMRESRELTLKNTLVPFPCVFAAGPKQGKYHSFQSPSLEAGGRG